MHAVDMPGPAAEEPRGGSGAPSRRYFQCFYDSFNQPRPSPFLERIDALEQEEEEARLHVWRAEAASALMNRAMMEAGGLSPPRAALCPFEVVGGERAGRRALGRDYYRMLLEGCAMEESLRRRCLLFVAEPRARQHLQGEEAVDWLGARHRLFARLDAQEREERQRRPLAVLEWQQQRAYQRFHMEQEERGGRAEVERLERLNMGLLADAFGTHYRAARLHQLRWERRREHLSVEATREITIAEALHRTDVHLDQHTRFRYLGSEEVKDFLGTRRNTLINEMTEALLS